MLKQLKVFFYWKNKVRIRQLYGNYKLFNLENNSLIMFFLHYLSNFGKLLGIAIMFSIGFGSAYIFKNYISNDINIFLQIIFIYMLWNGIEEGYSTGRWISSSMEESWLLPSTPLSRKKYLIFLWLEESSWHMKLSFFSNIAALVGIGLVLQYDVLNLLLAIVMAVIIGKLISFLVTLVNYYRVKNNNSLKGSAMIKDIISMIILASAVIYITKTYAAWLVSLIIKVANNPKMSEDDYTKWLEEGFIITKEIILNINYAIFFDNNIMPYTLLAQIAQGTFQSLFLLFIYISTLCLCILLGFKFLNKKDSLTFTETSFIDNILLKIFILVNKLFYNSKVKISHANYYLISLIKNQLTKINIFAALGGYSWLIIIFTYTFISHTPEQFSFKFSLAFAVIFSAIIPIVVIKGVYKGCRTKLSLTVKDLFYNS